MKKITSVIAGLAALAWASYAYAHHSAAMFDGSKRIVLKGEVKQFQWTNPHSWLHVTVGADTKQEIDWSVEMTSPNLLARAGWRPSTVKPGTGITVIVSPLRDGSPGGLFRCAVMHDGRVLTYQSVSAPSERAKRATKAAAKGTDWEAICTGKAK